MRLSAIEIEVGDLSENLPTCRRLNYLVSFRNEAGEDCQRRHETLVNEQAFDDTPGIARIVSHAVRDLLIEEADAVAYRSS